MGAWSSEKERERMLKCVERDKGEGNFCLLRIVCDRRGETVI